MISHILKVRFFRILKSIKGIKHEIPTWNGHVKKIVLKKLGIVHGHVFLSASFNKALHTYLFQ